MHHQQAQSLLGKAAALLMHEPSNWHYTLKKMSSDDENLFPDASLLWDCEGCAPPPRFDIPPPPRPPWMEEVDECHKDVDRTESLSEWLSQMQTCDSTLIRDSQSYFEDTFHSIAIIVVSSIVLVIFMLSVGLYFFKKRKNFRECHQRSSQLDGPLHRPIPGRLVGNVNPAIDCSTPTHLSHTIGPLKPSQILYEGQAVTSLTSSGHTMTRCLANHYIPDSHQKMMTLDHVMRKQAIADDFRQRFGPLPDRRNVMELSERPPMMMSTTAAQPAQFVHHPSEVYQVSNASDYPHIVIGGKPFFLVPSSTSSNVADNMNSESYAYPQHMPIYEEIDYTTVSAPLGSAGSANLTMMMDRPLSSTASHSNSAHTNTSELSSGDSSSSSSQKIIIEEQQQQNNTPRHQAQQRVRLADGIERSRSPQSPYSARLNNKTNNSVYYYGDTLKKSSADKVNTKVTLNDEKSNAGSTLV